MSGWRSSTDGEPFDSRSLTEDYFVGLQVHKLGYSQLFVVPAGAFSAQQERSPGLVCLGTTFASEATRSYFPRTVRQAIRQRSRWAIGIALQSWQRFGWNAGAGQTYWLWRDPKGPGKSPGSDAGEPDFLLRHGAPGLDPAQRRGWAISASLPMSRQQWHGCCWPIYVCCSGGWWSAGHSDGLFTAGGTR